MVPEEQPTPVDGRSFRLPRQSRPRFLDRGRVPGANKRSVLGALALLVGVVAMTSVEGLPIGVPLIVVGLYLLAEPLLGVPRAG